MLVGLALWATSARAEAAVAYPVVLAAGDIADCSDGNNGPKLTARLLGSHVGTVLAIGDLTYPDGAPAEYTSCYGPSWGRYKSRTRPVPGNHEYNTPGATGYFGYWGAQARPSGTSYYSLDLGDWHLVALDFEIAISATSPQATWLRTDLAATGKRCKLAYLHRPRWNSDSLGDTDFLADAYQIMYDNRVTLLLSGHAHEYERFAPKAPDGTIDNARGGRQFVVGTGGAFVDGGGAARRPKEGPRHRRLAPAEAGSQVLDAHSYGVLRLALRKAGYSWRFLPAAGFGFTDSGSGTRVLKG